MSCSSHLPWYFSTGEPDSRGWTNASPGIKRAAAIQTNFKTFGAEVAALKKYRILAFLTGVMVFLGGCTIFGKSLTYRPMVTGFYVNSSGSTDPLPSLEKYGTDLNIFSPLWYHVASDGSLESQVQPQAVSIARKDKLKIVPLVNLATNNSAVLTNATARTAAVNNLVAAVKANNWDGLNIDFELIPASATSNFSYDRTYLDDFMKDLHGKLKALGKETDMSVLPHYQVSANVSSIYDYSALAPYVNHVTLMTYDKSQGSSPPGPVAPFSWVKQNITTALKQGFKPEQISLGVASYGYNWPAGQSGGFSEPTKAIMHNADNLGVQVKWSGEYQEPFYYYTDTAGNKREVWFENHVTLKTKIDLVKKYRLYGISIWRLGFEDPSFWSVITTNIPKT